MTLPALPVTRNAQMFVAGCILFLGISLPHTAAAQAIPIACGQTLSGTIISSAEEITYSFSANAGEAVILAAVTTSGTMVARLDLYLNGVKVSGGDNGSGNTATGSVVLPSTGTYVVIVRDSAFTRTGTYNLHLAFTTGRCADQIGCGDLLGGTIGGPAGGAAQHNSYAFSATAGEAVILGAVTTSGTMVARLDLYLNGVKISGGDNGSGNTATGSVVLPSTGTYVVMVRDSALNRTGGYNLHLAFTTGRCADPIGCGQLLGGNVGGAAQHNSYAFSATAGEAVILAAVTTSGTLVARLDLYLNGVKISGGDNGSGNTATGSVVLPSTGTYVVMVRDSALNRTGGYNLHLAFTTGRCAGPIGCGQLLGGNVGGAAQHDSYAFSATAGEAVILAAVTTSGTMVARLDLYLNGVKVSGGDNGSGNTATGSVVLPSTGTYVVMVRDSALNRTGGYNLHLAFTTGRCAGPIGCGQLLGGNVGGAAQHNSYTFSATAGEAVILAAVTTSGTMVARLDLYFNGVKVSGGDNGSGNTATGSVVLPSTGTYVVVVRDSALNRTGGYNLHLAFTTGRCADPIGCGQLLGGNVGGAAQHNSYAFSATAGEAVILAAVTTSGTMVARLDLYLNGVKVSGGDNGSGNTATGSVVLPSTGTYVVMVRDSALNRLGSYNLALQFTTGRCAIPISCGLMPDGNIVGPAQLDGYSFSATAEQAVVLAAVATSGTLVARLDLYFNGAKVIGGDNGSGNGATGSVVLPTTGRYTVIVRDTSLTRTGRYALNLSLTAGACPSSLRNLIDLNADGSGDVFLYSKATGARRFEVTTSGGFSESSGAWDPGWQVYPASLNADGYTDFFLYDPQRGFWIQSVNHGGDGTFTNTLGNWDNSWTVVPSDLDGDGLTDMFVYNFNNGVWVKCFVDGSGGFKGYSAGNWDPGWTFYTADLNGDRRDDFFLYNRTNGIWVEAFSQAGFGTFDYPASGQWDPGWQVVPADLNGDGRTDLFLLNAQGTHVNALSIASGGFDYVGGPQWAPGWTVAPGDLNNDGRSDLFLYNPVSGNWTEAFSNAAGGFTLVPGAWDPGWTLTTTDFNADGRADLILSRATGAWVQAINTGTASFTFVAGNWGTGWTVFARKPSDHH